MLWLLFLTYIAQARDLQEANRILTSIIDQNSEKIPCQSYACKPDHMEFTDFTCVYYDNSTTTNWLRPCPQDKQYTYCPNESSFNQTCTLPPDPETYTSWPGEPCDKNSTCAYGYCNSKGTCQGVTSGNQCIVNDECSPGLYCEEHAKIGHACYIQFGYQEYGCADSFQCENGLICNNTRCMPALTQTEGIYVEDCLDNKSEQWATQMCQGGKCLKPISKDKGMTITCNSPLDCNSTAYRDDLYNLVYYGECQCGQNNKGDAYCGLLPGESVMSEYLEKKKEWYESSAIKKCNTNRRLNQKCMKAYWHDDDYDEYMFLYWRQELWPLIQDNDDCVKAIYTSVYYESQQEYKEDDDFSALLSLGLVILLIS